MISRAKFTADLSAGEKFQDFIADCFLRRRRIVLTFHRTAKAQLTIGEGKNGLEVKLDRRFRETGALYVEYEHRVGGKVLPSGVARADNSAYFLIGDEDTFWVFEKKTFAAWCSDFAPRAVTCHHGDVPTSGYRVSLYDADTQCIEKWKDARLAYAVELLEQCRVCTYLLTSSLAACNCER